MRATGCPGHPVLRMGGGPPPQRATGLSRRQTKLLTQTLFVRGGMTPPHACDGCPGHPVLRGGG